MVFLHLIPVSNSLFKRRSFVLCHGVDRRPIRSESRLIVLPDRRGVRQNRRGPRQAAPAIEGVIAAVAEEASPQHADEILAKVLGHGEVDEKVEEATDGSGDVLYVVEVEISWRGGVADPLVTGPETNLEHEIGNIAGDEDDDQRQRHLTQVAKALLYQGRIADCRR